MIFVFCGFGYILDRFFGFCAKKLQVFGFGVRAVCGFFMFNIWFSVFAKNIDGFSDLIFDAVFGFSCLTYLGCGFFSNLSGFSLGCENVTVLTVLHAVFGFYRTSFSVFWFWMIFCTVFRFLIGPNAPLLPIKVSSSL